MDEGWTRWVFDANRIPFTTVHDRDLRAGGLRAKFDAILLPDQAPVQLRRGLGAPYPDSLRGGIGDAGAAALKAFVNEGGTVLAFNEASEYAIETMELPVKNVLANVRNTDFYAPGSMFAVDVDRAHPLAGSYTAPVPAVWFEDSPTFEITDAAKASAVLRYQNAGDPLLSGWLLGAARLNGRAAMVDAAVSAFGGLDVLVANAGYADRTGLDDLTPERFEESLRVIGTGFLRLARAARSPMRA